MKATGRKVEGQGAGKGTRKVKVSGENTRKGGGGTGRRLELASQR